MNPLDLGELLASLPATFGHYPDNSTVIASFERSETPGALNPGPFIRVDTGDRKTLREALNAVESFSPAAVFGFIITDNPEASDLNTLAEHPLLSGIWQLNTLSEGEPVTLVYASPELNAPATATVAAVHASPITRHVLSHGGIIRASRAELQEAYSYAPELLTETQHRAAAFWSERLAGETSTGAQLGALLHFIAGELAAAERTHLAAFGESLPNRPYLLGGVAICLSPDDKRARDLLIGVAQEHPAAAAVVLTLLARTHADNAVRANALAILAILDAAGPMTDHAVQLMLASEADPANRLVRLLVTSMNAGRLRETLTAIKQGVTQTREGHLM